MRKNRIPQGKMGKTYGFSNGFSYGLPVALPSYPAQEQTPCAVQNRVTSDGRAGGCRHPDVMDDLPSGKICSSLQGKTTIFDR